MPSPPGEGILFSGCPSIRTDLVTTISREILLPQYDVTSLNETYREYLRTQY